MWLLVLVLVLNVPNWPEGQPQPMTEFTIEFRSERECLVARDWWLEHGDAQPAGMPEQWDTLLQSCEPANALIASAPRAPLG